MGQKAKNAGKKKSNPSSGKLANAPSCEYGNPKKGIISLVGDSRYPPSKEWMEEVDMMLKSNFSASVAVEKCKKGRACVRSTDLVKSPCVFIPEDDVRHMWNSQRV
jgi:hypothetical protein